ncbi:MAG: hypothetical protein NC244_07015 [Alistipes senegalensis]|nr:hypothetical protein [Alistipes senegalensis]
MPVSYILQKLDDLKKSLDNLGWSLSEHKRDTCENIIELEKRIKLLEQMHSANRLKGDDNNERK